MTTSRDPWNLDQLARLAGMTAAGRACILTPDAARDVVRALFNHNDGIRHIHQDVWPEVWDSEPDLREHVESTMRTRLIEEVLSDGFIPIAMPTFEIFPRLNCQTKLVMSVPVRRVS